ncbi:MAG: hypothetical protein B1H40_01490 [Candidatus Latescibacteria bacterium 4484_181]|nr:MAG: hypothetical protein B1H40_01490 [Candidatus Latescibacteria bacterium 4484_181]
MKTHRYQVNGKFKIFLRSADNVHSIWMGAAGEQYQTLPVSQNRPLLGSPIVVISVIVRK